MRQRSITVTEFKRIGDFTLHAWRGGSLHGYGYKWAVWELSNRRMEGEADSLAQAKRRAEDAFKQWQRGHPRMLFNPGQMIGWRKRHDGVWLKDVGQNISLHAWPWSGGGFAGHSHGWSVYELAMHRKGGLADSLDQAKRFSEDAFRQWKRGHARMLFNPGWKTSRSPYGRREIRHILKTQDGYELWVSPNYNEGYYWIVFKNASQVAEGSERTKAAAQKAALKGYHEAGRKKPRMLFNPALAEKWDRMTKIQRGSLLRLIGVLPEAVANISSQPWASVPFAVKMKLKWGWKENPKRRRWEIEMLTKSDAKKLRKWWHGHTGRSHRIYRSERHRKFYKLVRENPDDPRFENLAQAQRGRPEEAGQRIQMAQISQLYGDIAEHVGDLTHRMSQQISFFKGGYPWVEEKVRKGLNALTRPYGFEREVLEQIESNTEYYRKHGSLPRWWTSPRAALIRLKRLGRLYAAEHRKLPVFNAVQRIARDAAIAVGEWRFKDAVTKLRTLKYLIDKGPDVWAGHAMKTKNNPSGIASRVISAAEKQWWKRAIKDLSDKAPDAVHGAVERLVRSYKYGMDHGKVREALWSIANKYFINRPSRSRLTTYYVAKFRSPVLGDVFWTAVTSMDRLPTSVVSHVYKVSARDLASALAQGRAAYERSGKAFGEKVQSLSKPRPRMLFNSDYKWKLQRHSLYNYIYVGPQDEIVAFVHRDHPGNWKWFFDEKHSGRTRSKVKAMAAVEKYVVEQSKLRPRMLFNTRNK